MLARYYASGFGRMLQVDPVDDYDFNDPMSFNKYSYVRCNPIMGTDPTGMAEEESPARKHFNLVSGKRAAQGAAAHAGATIAHDGKQRANYVSKCKTATPQQRDQLKLETRENLSPVGKALSENAATKPERVASRALKTDAELAESAGRTNSSWNKVGKVGEASGKVLLGVGVGISAYNIASAPEGEKIKAASKEGGSWAGALSFGEAGAEGGAEIGSFGGPVGAAVGAVVGGIGGAIVGATLGEKAGENIYNYFAGEE